MAGFLNFIFAAYVVVAPYLDVLLFTTLHDITDNILASSDIPSLLSFWEPAGSIESSPPEAVHSSYEVPESFQIPLDSLQPSGNLGILDHPFLTAFAELVSPWSPFQSSQSSLASASSPFDKYRLFAVLLFFTAALTIAECIANPIVDPVADEVRHSPERIPGDISPAETPLDEASQSDLKVLDQPAALESSPRSSLEATANAIHSAQTVPSSTASPASPCQADTNAFIFPTVVFADPVVFPTGDPDACSDEGASPLASPDLEHDENPEDCQHDQDLVASSDLVGESSDTSLPLENVCDAGPPTIPSFDFLEPLVCAPPDLTEPLLQETLDATVSDGELELPSPEIPSQPASPSVSNPFADPPEDAGFVTGTPKQLGQSPSLGSQSSLDLNVEDVSSELLNRPLLLPSALACAESPAISEVSTCGGKEQYLATKEEEAAIKSPASEVDLIQLDGCAVGGSTVEEAAAVQDSKTDEKSTSILDEPNVEEASCIPPGLSLLTPSNSLTEVVGSRMSAADWTAIRCFFGMEDDLANADKPNQRTFVRDYRTPLQHAEPAKKVPSTVSASPSLDDPFTSPTVSLASWAMLGHRRVVTEPPSYSVRTWFAEEINPTPVLSAEKVHQEIFRSELSAIPFAELNERFPLKSPELQERFPSISSRVGIIPHTPSYARFEPRAQMEFLIGEESSALQLAMASKPKLKRRHSVSVMSSPYGLSKAAFLGPYLAYSFQRSYAQATGLNANGSSGRVVTLPADSVVPTATAGRPQVVQLNRNRRGSDVSLNGDKTRAQYVPKLRQNTRSLPDVRSSQSEPKEAAEPSPSKPVSLRRSIPGWVPVPRAQSAPVRKRANTLQTNVAPAIAAPEDTSSHKRAISEGSSDTGGGESKRARLSGPSPPAKPSPDLSQWPSLPASASTSTDRASTSAPLDPPAPVQPQSLPRTRRRSSSRPPQLLIARPPDLETIIGSPATSPPPAPASATVVHHVPEMKSWGAMAAMIAGGSGKQQEEKQVAVAVPQPAKVGEAFPRIDDDGAMQAFERELEASTSGV